MQNIFIAGCGYIGERIAYLYKDRGDDVICMVRSTEHALKLRLSGFVTTASSLDNSSDPLEFTVANRVLFYLIPPPGGGISDTRARSFLSNISEAGKPSKIVYMSTTSVYGGNNGETITEESTANPDTAMGKRRLDAETAFRDYAALNGVPLILLRVSGIYGPGRLPLMQISQGQPLLNENESGPSNRIHADDLSKICIAAAELAGDGDIFNISDGHPTSMTTYFNACADALGYPRQPQIPLDEAREVMSPLMFSYISSTRIVDNSRMLKSLGVKLLYKDLNEGIAASLPPGIP
ncbi:MAG: SDR family oxidoreductase [Desulfuromonadaceae bacterium]|nr:SDR family oxidoreductase [Desulfuromonadaceae bacterium]MDD2854964.1 SDR family oxidoreductase [Desulfuromonadaceae bacterium]